MNLATLFFVSAPYIVAFLLLYGLHQLALKILRHSAPESKLRKLLEKTTANDVEMVMAALLIIGVIALTFYYA